MNRIEKIGRISIIDQAYVTKDDKDNQELFNYLSSRDFHNYLNYIERSNNTSKYPYLKNYSLDKYQTAEDLINITALLHNKTSFQKEVSSNKYQEIHDKTIGHINYLKDYYYQLIQEYEYIDCPSPSQLLLMCNYSKMAEVLQFCTQEIKNWYAIVKDNTKERVCINHGNLALNHLINNDKKYLISWDRAQVDTPILDIITLYHNEWDNLNFQNILEIYLNKCQLSDAEKKLLFINLCIPKIITNYDDEYLKTIEVRKLFDYIYKTEELMRPYYSK